MVFVFSDLTDIHPFEERVCVCVCVKMKSLCFSLLLLTLHIVSDAQIVTNVMPKTGSLNGATKLTIQGDGFAQESQFSLDSSSSDYGNSVQLVSSTRSVPCDVEKISTNSKQIVCYTRAMPEDDYTVHVSVDGVSVPDSNLCYGYIRSYWCSFYPRRYATPTVNRLASLTGLPGSLIAMEGMIFTDLYGVSRTRSSSGLTVKIIRSYIGGMPCELLQPNSGIPYELTLTYAYGYGYGRMSCKMTGTYVGHHNFSFIIDGEYGRSLPDISVYYVSSLNKLTMFQTYAEVTGISPSEGSVEGGTILTIYGNFFDQTDYPATVLVGGLNCKILSLSDNNITCQSPQYQPVNTTVFPGNRGVKMEMWINNMPGSLDEVLSYSENTAGYSTSRTDSLSYTWPWGVNYFVGRLRGFFVPTETENHTFYIRGTGPSALYFSQTGNPQDKVKIGYSLYGTNSYFSYGTQQSDSMLLNKGTAYYIEAVMQSSPGTASVEVGLFMEKSDFTAQQTPEAINEVQIISTNYDILVERQVVVFENWNISEPVNEVQSVNIYSNCLELNMCGYTYYRLRYNSESTAPIAVSASEEEVQNALNALWSIKPDTVQVTKVDINEGVVYNVTFNSSRGDFQTFSYDTTGSDINITVTEVTKGQPSLETFTLQWDGVSSRPINFNASETEVKSAVEEMLLPECSRNIIPIENNDVVYFKDFEDSMYWGYAWQMGARVSSSDAFCGQYSIINPDYLFLYYEVNTLGVTYGQIPLETYSSLCFAYKGWMRNVIEVDFSFINTNGYQDYRTETIPTLIQAGNVWNYICVDLLTPLETAYPGSAYTLKSLRLFRETPTQNFYVDVVYIGKSPLVSDSEVAIEMRRPPALAAQGLYVQSISVNKLQNTEASQVSYEVIATPLDCGHGFPLLAVEFLQVSNSSDDAATYKDGAASVSITRMSRASPPLSGTFDLEIYGTRVQGLAPDVTAEDLQYALQSVPAMGQLQITRNGDCRGYNWRVEWRSNPGSQSLIQINSSSVVGVNPRVTALVQTKGGLLRSRIMGDFLRVPESSPQVQVMINRIPSMCSGDCRFEWLASRTPNIKGISPSGGSYAMGTILTISGSGFASEGATVLVGNVECSVLQLNTTVITCSVGQAGSGTQPVSLSFSSLGYAQQVEGGFNFTNQMGVFSISPSIGSVTGGTFLTVSGYGFGDGITVLIGSDVCALTSVYVDKLTCITPPGASGIVPVTLEMEGIMVFPNMSFTYDETQTPFVTDLMPHVANVMGNQILTILGTNFQDQGNQSKVLIGAEACQIVQWSSSNITCLLPQLPPGPYSILVQTENLGYAKISEDINGTIEYMLRVTDIHPLHGSLYGGTRVTVTGSGFSTNASQNLVSLGEAHCEISAASEDSVVCMVQPRETTYTVTNNGIHPDYGMGYMWSPSSVTAQVGDTVVWQWQAPPFVSGIGYRVISVSSPSSVNYDGIGFISGDTNTQSGFFSYRFTAPGTYYYSSGYIDTGLQRFMQGVVNVKPLEDEHNRLKISVAGIEANYVPDAHLSSRPDPDCTAVPPACSQNVGPPQPTDGFLFSLVACVSPTVILITPGQGTADTIIQIEGTGFSDISCANEVTVGGQSCQVINSTTTAITCQLGSENGLEVGIAHSVTVRVDNLGLAMMSMISEMGRRFVVLPMVSSISPSTGATTGRTRLVVQGSGFLSSQVTTVTVVGEPCIIQSINYTTITCDTSPASARTGFVDVRIGAIGSSCPNSCAYEYSPLLVPHVTDLSPSDVSGNITMVTVTGAGFGSQLGDVAVYAGDVALAVIEVTDSNITLEVGPLPAGEHAVRVVILSKGLADGEVTLRSIATATLSPSSGSTQGGTPILITGNGFLAGNTSVTVDGSPCLLQYVQPDEMLCLTAAHEAGIVPVWIQVLSVMYPALTFNYTQADTPLVAAVSPVTGPSGTIVTLTGSGFGTDIQVVTVTMGGVACSVIAFNDTEIQCTVGIHAGGTFPVVLYHKVKGYALSRVSFNYELLLDGVVPSEGGYGGGTILNVQGSGFDPESSQVLICGNECKVQTAWSSSTNLYCEVPQSNSSSEQQLCTVQVLNGPASVNSVDAFSYKTSLTPVVTTVSPRRGGTAGGTRLTITGSNFSPNISEVNVTIAGSVCDVEFANSTCIICVTNAQPRSQQAKVRVAIADQGIAKMDSADFFYIDVWSSKYSWGGLSPPEAGMFVVITKGQTILLDTSTPVLKMLLIQGGTLVFDEADIELQAENILITDGGVLQIGTEMKPFQHKAIITLHGHLRSLELPIYGAKTLAVREGVLDLHGIPIPVTWTHLNMTAPANSSTVILTQSVTWKAGDQIVIASTGDSYSQTENEMRTIASVSDDGRTLNLTQPLKYTHAAVSVTLPNGKLFKGRAEVGLLTRNIVVRGSNNIEWNDNIEACPAGFDTGEFATQTCFQGRFGEEIGSDQFGGCIMFHAPKPNQNLAIGRLEYVEIYYAGQAFQLGRHPINWHLMGDVHESYVRGCSIHQSFNRAISIHSTHNLLVERNVIYDIMGGAFFIEDGIETGNILQHNLAVFVKQSTSLLNDDITPAAYWVTNPNNTIRHNAAAGGTHFGFWYRMHDNPDNPSYDPSVCPKRIPLGEFFNNTVHSQGWFGLWVYEEYFPMTGGTCYSSVPQPAIFCSLTAWNCEKGAEWVNVGAVQFSDFLIVNNKEAGIEFKRIFPWSVSNWGKAGGALLGNSTIVGHMEELSAQPGQCTGRGIVLPLDDGMSVLSTAFVNFDQPACAAIAVASVDGVCTDRCGGWNCRFSGIQFYSSPNKAAFRWEHEVALVDMDGSLTGNVNYTVVPYSALLDPAHCSFGADWSVGFRGFVCDGTVSFHRTIFTYPYPYSLWFTNLIITNSHGTSSIAFLLYRVTHFWAWMAMLPSSETYNCYFQGADFITDISYTAMFYGFKENDFIIIRHNLTQSPDRFRIIDYRNASVLPLNVSRNVNGDWYFNETTKILDYIVSRRGAPMWRSSSVDPTVVDIQINLQLEHCFYKGCIAPPMELPSFGPSINANNYNNASGFTRPSGVVLWSNDSFWKSSPENNYKVPAEGDNVIIPSDIWMLVDIDIPSLNKISIYGVLEIPDTMNETLTPGGQYRNVAINVTYINIQGGRLIAGWPDNPFKGQLSIVLKGNHFTPEWPLPNGPNQGAKVLGVFGDLDLYGIPHNVYHTKLASTAPAGSSTITLQDAVDWQVGDDIVISTTSYNPWQTEVRRITAVSISGQILTLNQSLFYNHNGESFNVSGTEKSYTLAGDVGLLSRNIKIIGEDYPNLYKESFGGRVLVGSFYSRGVTYRGRAQIRNVEFYHTGQYGYPDPVDPRYSVAFLNVGEIVGNESYIRGCSFHQGFSPAIGVFGTNGLSIDDNVIYFTVGEGIRVWGSNSRIRRNLVTMSVWPGAYQDRQDSANFQWNAAIEVDMGQNVVLQDNVVAGYERVAYRINGEPCPDAPNSVEPWKQNEAHGGLFGVYMNKDGLPSCSLVQGFFVWRSFDYGIYVQVPVTVQISNVTLVDNGMGIMSSIYSPPSIFHQYSNKKVHIQSALIVGSSPTLDCSDLLLSTDANIRLSAAHRAPRPPNGGRSGICWPTFESEHNQAPIAPHQGSTSYDAITGLMTVADTTFVGFGNTCSNQMTVMFMTNPMNEDLQHPVHVERVTMVDSIEDAKIFIHRPDLRMVSPAFCVDMDCDAKKKALLKDLDGSFLGAVGAVVPQSEFEWNGDKRRGLGDYRIPKVMLTSLNGSRIPVDQIAPNKGIIRDTNCTYMAVWQSHKCFGLNYGMLVIESLDVDTETRRLSPVAVLGDRYIDLLNGPPSHGFCSGYTCRRRVSLFHSIVATNKSFDVFFTSTTPQKLRLMLLNADHSEAVRVALYYSKPQRLDVYVNNSFVAPTNALWNSGRTDFTLQQPSFEGQFIPKLDSDVVGSNFFESTYRMMNVMLRGSTPVEIRTSPLLFISFELPAMTEEQFFGDKLVQNLAAFLKIPANMIRVSKVVREGRRQRRATGLTVEVQISNPPVLQASNTTSNDYSILANVTDALGQAVVAGTLSQSIGFNVSSVGIVPPSPPPSDPKWAQVASTEVTRTDPAVSFVSSVTSLQVIVQPMVEEFGGPLIQQPGIMAVDSTGNCVSVGVTSLTLTAGLKDSNGNSIEGLQGNTTLPFDSCWANFSDLSISAVGSSMRMSFTMNTVDARSQVFTVKAAGNTTVGNTTVGNTTVGNTTVGSVSSTARKSGGFILFPLVLFSYLYLSIM